MSYANQVIRWGMIGCGDVAERKSAPAYQRVTGFSLQAVASRGYLKAQDYAKRHQIPQCYQDINQLIADPHIDAIYIATPPDSHYQYAMRVASADKICCIEKPMAATYAQCQELVDAFAHRQSPLFVAYYRRCLPGFVQLKSLLSQGVIGQPLAVNWRYSRPPAQRDLSGDDNWRTQVSVAPGGYFDDIGCHGLNLFAYFFGDYAEVSGQANNLVGLYSAPDNLVASWAHQSGVLGSAHWQFCASFYQDEVEIIGIEGSICLSVFGGSPAKIITGDRQQMIQMQKPETVQLPFVQKMREHLDGTCLHPSLGDSAAHTNWVMEQIAKAKAVDK